jgi:S-formylglutathione hydrolase FrmB
VSALASHRRWFILALAAALVVVTNAIAASADEISAAVKDEQGILVHSVVSPYQAGTTKINVLVPDKLGAGERCKVLYVLPVEAGDGQRWGDAMGEVLKHDLHNKYRLICVLPTFSHLPWYADHPSDDRIRQETYFLKVVVPFVEKMYPARGDAAGRLLVGFSKSGWGAWSLLLRHPDMFARAAAWDAPLTMDAPNRYGMQEIFATQENFEQYRITSLLRQRAEQLVGAPRLALLGYGSFRTRHQATHTQLADLKIAHEYRDGPQREHAWGSGWLPEAVEWLARDLVQKP